jgi:hypothetical protein
VIALCPDRSWDDEAPVVAWLFAGRSAAVLKELHALVQAASTPQFTPVMSPLLQWTTDDPPIGFPIETHEQVAIVGSSMPGYDGSA